MNPETPHTIIDHGANAAESLNKWYIGLVAVGGMLLWAHKTIRAVWDYWRFWVRFPQQWVPFREGVEVLKSSVSKIDARLSDIELCDARRSAQIDRITGHMEDDFFHRHQPSFECDGTGSNSLVSYAYCLLVGVSTQDDMNENQWRNFINPREVDYYHGRFLKASADRLLTFRDEVEVIDVHRQSRGRWRIVARFVGDPANVHGTQYIGNLYPADDKAKAIADKYGWESIE